MIDGERALWEIKKMKVDIKKIVQKMEYYIEAKVEMEWKEYGDRSYAEWVFMEEHEKINFPDVEEWKIWKAANLKLNTFYTDIVSNSHYEFNKRFEHLLWDSLRTVLL